MTLDWIGTKPDFLSHLFHFKLWTIIFLRCQSGQPRLSVKLVKGGLKMCQEKFEKPVRPLEASLLLASSRPLAFPAAQLASCCSAHPPTLFGLAFDHINFVQNDLIDFTYILTVQHLMA